MTNYKERLLIHGLVSVFTPSELKVGTKVKKMLVEQLHLNSKEAQQAIRDAFNLARRLSWEGEGVSSR